ncbi:hypothetical protein [Vibrio diazotrophicus]|uniref:hypothetical protein n=1 Tax=Vibrio diazotrophicus TaxID=685 RepID=UPI000C9E404E|nr:hypothetical protein [Vibrio diazotrophicus]PNH81352.1 hypothetical protein C1N27_07350 [Vibrio diazotrophicus]
MNDVFAGIAEARKRLKANGGKTNPKAKPKAKTLEQQRNELLAKLEAEKAEIERLEQLKASEKVDGVEAALKAEGLIK